MEDKQQKSKDFLLKLGWIMFFLLLCFMIGMIIGPKLVTGASWPLDKYNTCNLPSINKTGLDCEIFWCNTINECNYSIIKEVCICNQIINATVNISSTNYTDLFNNFSIILSNFTANMSFNDSNAKDFCKNYTDYYILTLRNSMLDRIDNKTMVNSYYSPETESATFPPWAIILIVVVVMGGLVYIVTVSKRKPAYQVTEAIRNPIKRSLEVQKNE